MIFLITHLKHLVLQVELGYLQLVSQEYREIILDINYNLAL